MNPRNADLQLEVEPGVILHDSTDEGLARRWARHACGTRWDQLTPTEKNTHIAEALRELHRDARVDLRGHHPCTY